MSQAMTVYGRIQMIENKIQTRKANAPLFPKSIATAPGGSSGSVVSSANRFKKATALAQSQQTSSRISAAAMSLEATGNRLERIAEANENV